MLDDLDRRAARFGVPGELVDGRVQARHGVGAGARDQHREVRRNLVGSDLVFAAAPSTSRSTLGGRPPDSDATRQALDALIAGRRSNQLAAARRITGVRSWSSRTGA